MFYFVGPSESQLAGKLHRPGAIFHIESPGWKACNSPVWLHLSFSRDKQAQIQRERAMQEEWAKSTMTAVGYIKGLQTQRGSDHTAHNWSSSCACVCVCDRWTFRAMWTDTVTHTCVLSSNQHCFYSEQFRQWTSLKALAAEDQVSHNLHFFGVGGILS